MARLRHFNVLANRKLYDTLPNLYKLRGACLRVRLQIPALSPHVGLVVVVHLAEQGLPGVLWTINRIWRPTQTDQKFLSFAFSSL